MASTYISVNIHYVFSTKGRKNLISNEIKPRLWQFMGGIARKNKMVAYAVGGTENHVHVLLSIPATINIAEAIKLIKGGSSKWVNDEFIVPGGFKWQEGYGAFSVSQRGLQRTIAYILNQEDHHRKKSFRDEYVDFLNQCGIQYDERFLLG
mgnify:FL=1